VNTARWLAGIIVRDLRAVQREIEAYPSDAAVWVRPDTIPNSAGTLAIHLAGNLRHFIGATLGHTGYVRDRDAEFSRRDVPRTDILRELDATIADMDAVLPSLTDAQMDAPFPLPVANRQITTGDLLLHLAVHLTYHLGQIDYHRRLVAGNAASIGAVAPAELSSARSAN
jgi:uncharacterized damage-inducible protein DinB